VEVVAEDRAHEGGAVTTSTAPAVSFAGPGPWQQRLHVEHVWGTQVVIDARGERLPDDADATFARAVDLLHRIDAWFSTYRADSPITLHRNGLVDLERLPTVVQEVLASCRDARMITRGAFDPWAVPGGVDPSGYVKGWAADQVAELFADAGIGNVCVDASGDIACRGRQAPDELWAIGITNPYDTQQVIEVVHVGDGAVATSGLYERGHHVSNPRTGHAEAHCDSATVVGPDAGLADALATAALVAGPVCAAWFAGLPGWSVYLVKDGVVSFFGPAFEHA
jgi:FAD:protein FMN transferase